MIDYLSRGVPSLHRSDDIATPLARLQQVDTREQIDAASALEILTQGAAQ